MIVLLRRQLVLLSLLLFLINPIFISSIEDNGDGGKLSSEECLSLGNSALSENAYTKAILSYEQGIAALQDGEPLLTILSLETNLATAYSYIGGKDEKAFEHYGKAISAYKEQIDEIVDEEIVGDAQAITSQASFFYGMVLQDVDASKSVEMYKYSVKLDPNLWAGWANLGASYVTEEAFDYNFSLWEVKNVWKR